MVSSWFLLSCFLVFLGVMLGLAILIAWLFFRDGANE